MKLSIAAEGFLMYMRSEGYSPSTIKIYTYVLKTLGEFLDDPNIESIKTLQIRKYFLYLREDYKPKRLNSDNDKPLAGSTLQNHWKGIRTFFKWSQMELGNRNRPDLDLKMPKNNARVIEPISVGEITKLIAAVQSSEEVQPSNRKSFRIKRRTASRDMAIILILIDTGLRIGELVRLNTADVSLEKQELFIQPYGNSNMKTKSRIVPIGAKTKTAIWKYLSARENNEALFTAERTENRLTTTAVRQLLEDLGKKAGINNLHPHRFRHTFAIQFLRNGGDIYTLKAILGHSTLSMVEHYLQFSQVDYAAAHKRASPVDNWNIRV